MIIRHRLGAGALDYMNSAINAVAQEKRQSDHVVDHHVRRQIPPANTASASCG